LHNPIPLPFRGGELGDGLKQKKQHEPQPRIEPTPATAARGRTRGFWVGGIALAVTIGLCLFVVYYWDEVQSLSSYGYLGVLVINIVAGGTMIVPVPGLLVVFTMGSVLHPALVGLAAGLGEAAGAMIIYLTGWSGRGIVQGSRNPYVARVVAWVERRGTLAVFTMSAVFNPFFYPVTIAIGALRYQLWKFFLATWAGKTIKGLAVAYLGYLGLGSILRALGFI